MGQHRWGDEDFDWEALYKAERELSFWGRRIGRIGGDMKEKWGELRWYATLGTPERISDILYPGYYYYQWPADKEPFLNIIDQISIVYLRPLKPLFKAYKRFFYGYAYRRAVKKFPRVNAEILSCCEHPELLFKRERKIYEDIRRAEEEASLDEDSNF